jgi:hypothetical protein
MNTFVAILLGIFVGAVLFFLPFAGALFGGLIAAYLAKNKFGISLAIGGVVGIITAVVIFVLYIFVPVFISGIVTVNPSQPVQIPQTSNISQTGYISSSTYNNSNRNELVNLVAAITTLLTDGFILALPGGLVGGAVGGYLVRRKLENTNKTPKNLAPEKST